MHLRRLSYLAAIFVTIALPPFFAGGQTSPTPAGTTQLLSPSGRDESSGSTSHSDVPRQAEFAIGPADVIHVTVWKDADLSQTVTVDPNGFVSLPLLGTVRVAGMTTDQISAELGSRLATYVVSPQVTVSVVDIRSRQVYIMGKVGRAGGYPLLVPITVLQLIAQAGGLNAYAKRKDIYVLRAANGHSEKLLFNYDKVTRGDGSGNIVLQPGDTVIVP